MQSKVRDNRPERKFVADAALRSWLNKRKSARVPYTTPVEVLLDADKGLPESRQFITVQPRDLSQRGIAFYSDYAPCERPVIVKLGSARESLFLLARITRCERDFDDAQRRFVVGCEFVRRISISGNERTGERRRT